MFSFSTFLISAISIANLARGVSAAGAPAIVRRSRHVARQDGGKTWKQVEKYEGEKFLDGSWDFFNSDDPTHGLVNYQNAEAAKAKGLAVVKDGQLILSVDDHTELPPGAKRDSVRISSKNKYNGGLFIADFAAMPVGCSVWPAWWSVGPDWPAGGEIDILEGVHGTSTTNQYTLHTGAGCSADPGAKTTGSALGATCESSGNNNAGCAYRDSDARSYGQAFNDANGGVYAYLWDKDGIKIWFFSNADIPEDIKSGNPNPSSWSTPAANFPTASCDTSQHFHDHALTIDTTLCGDWAGAVYKDSGCPGTCQDAVADPKNFARTTTIKPPNLETDAAIPSIPPNSSTHEAYLNARDQKPARLKQACKRNTTTKAYALKDMYKGADFMK
ncbi:hypothetical protein H0H87_003243 [Tephrocybe sp. NHM501043]|nr:hypothetical protein H0H87_003243 [Tephrocybe sp. NHM501043]